MVALFMVALCFGRSRTQQYENADEGEAEGEAGDVRDGVARVAGSTGHKLLKPFYREAVSQHREDGACRNFANDCQTETEYRGGQYCKYNGMHQQVACVLYPVQ